MTDSEYARSIELPTDQIFKNLKNAKRCALDIGGSLAKLAYYSTLTKKRSCIVESNKSNGDEIYKISEEDEVIDQLHFIKFETKYIETCLGFIEENLIGSRDFMKGKIIKVTGGGAWKYKDYITKKLGVQVDKEDEMDCLIQGCNFLLKNIPDEVFAYQRHGNPEYNFQNLDSDGVFPYLLVNIGSGVSLFKVESETKYQRVGGTSLGGGTFWGLGSLLTSAKGFDELLDLAEQGDHRNVDMLVKDIYGGSCDHLGLAGNIIASTFGQAARSPMDKDEKSFQEADIAKSLLISISNDIGQISVLHAKLYNLKKIYFGGYFIRGHPMTMHTISFAINFWSKGEAQARFLRHEGYLGAIGAFLKGAQEGDVEKYCWDEHWGENYAGSSGLQSPKPSDDCFPIGRERSATFDMLELDRFAKPLVCCPLLLDPANYLPDTVDLTQDTEARNYWLDCFMEATDRFADRAVKSQHGKADAEQRAFLFKEKYLDRLRALKENPWTYGSLTVRSLLDTREHCLEEFLFVDPYSQQKQQENEYALRQLRARLSLLDSMGWEERQLALAKGLLAGNVFDWGAKEVAALLEHNLLNFSDALTQLQGRPWLMDGFDQWLERLKGPPHRSAVIFVDNSGFDMILGVFPFTRELLKRGTNVILCANSRPALNDVMFNELTVLTKKVAAISEVIRDATRDERLLIMESGQGSPCMDFRYIDYDLAERLKEQQTDLIVLEGMGRAIHTNFDASFNCEALKVAVIKNRWLAARLGGEMYGVVFKYEKVNEAVGAAKS